MDDKGKSTIIFLTFQFIKQLAFKNKKKLFVSYIFNLLLNPHF